MKLYKLLASRRLALILLLFFLGTAGLEVVLGLEQQGIRIYGSWWFIALSLLLLANLLTCTVQRGWLLVRGRVGVRRWMALGSILFHLGLAIVTAGVMFDQLTLWRGRMYIAETQSVNLATQGENIWHGVRQGPWGEAGLEGVHLRLDRLSVGYYPQGATREIRGDVTIRDYLTGQNSSGALKMNYPIRHRGVKFIITNYGFSPHFVLEDVSGPRPVVLAYSYVNLDFFAGGGGNEDGFQPAPGLMLWARFYPSLVWEKGFPVSHTTRLDNPWFKIRLEQAGQEEGGKPARTLHDGWLRPGEAMRIGDYRLAIDNLNYWLEIEASTERGFPVIVFGLWLGICGLVLRYWPEFAPLSESGNKAAAGGHSNETV